MRLGIIGGTGALDLFEVQSEESIESPFGDPSTCPARIRLSARDAFFIARHGRPHRIPPHRINYRANIDVLRQLGVEAVVAINAVGGIAPELTGGSIAIADQLVDYTWGRIHSFSDDDLSPLIHVEFAQPFSCSLRRMLLESASCAGIEVVDGGCVAVTQGPRLETSAEIRRLRGDGCDMVGMTTMPEAALAREAGLDYASVCVVANAAAGVGDEPISMDSIARVLAGAMDGVGAILRAMDAPAVKRD